MDKAESKKKSKKTRKSNGEGSVYQRKKDDLSWGFSKNIFLPHP